MATATKTPKNGQSASPKSFADRAEQLAQKTVFLDVIRHKIGRRRSQTGEKVDTKGNKKKLRIVKYVFDSDTYAEIVSTMQETYRWVNGLSLPGRCRYFRLPVDLLPDVYDRIEKTNEKLRKLVERFILEQAELQKKEKDDLKDMFNPDDYYSDDRLRKSFWLERELVELGTPGAEKVGKAFADQARKEAREKIKAEVDEIVLAMREQFQKLVSHLLEVLKPDDEGNRKRFQDSSIDNVVEWCDLFSKRNVLGDIELARLAEEAKKLLKGQDGKSLRKDEGLRDQLAKATAAIKTKADKAVANAPKRRIVFDDDETGDDE